MTEQQIPGVRRSSTMADHPVGPGDVPDTGRRARTAWVSLALGVAAQASCTVFVSAPAFLIPFFHSTRGISLAQAGTLAAIPTLGMVLTLIAWGALSDRIGERWVIAAGLVLTALCAAGAMTSQGYVPLGAFLLAGGMASASTNAASGRVVVGWFPREQRGMAMGIRQMCQPLGVTIAAVTIPVLAASHGVAAALAVPFALTAVFAIGCAWGIRNPPLARSAARPRPGNDGPGAPARAGVSAAMDANPYRHGFLWRIHAVSVLLVVPQFTLATFGLVWLITQLGWPALAAGVLVGVSQFLGALGRLAMGVLSDRVGSRVRPLRWIAWTACAGMVAVAALDHVTWGAAAAAFLFATCASVADNGLAYTSVAEAAGPAWAGRALGAQNTGQFIAASAVGPLIGTAIGVLGYPVSFALVALSPLAAVPLIPAPRAERDLL
jgi:MFS family permease